MKDSLNRLINRHKRIDRVEKPKKRRFKVILWKHTGRSILETIESYVTDIKHDLEIIFKPVKYFSKKALKGLDKYDLAEMEINNQSKRSVLNNDPVNEVRQPPPNQETIWFINDEPSPPKEGEKRITLLKSDGTKVGLDPDKVYF